MKTVIALGGIPNKTKVGGYGIDGRIFPVGAEPAAFKEHELQLTERWYPIQVKQKDKVGRLDIDAFQTAMRRSKRDKGFFVAFDYTDAALREIDRFFKADHAVISRRLTEKPATLLAGSAFPQRRRRDIFVEPQSKNKSSPVGAACRVHPFDDAAPTEFWP